MEYHIEKKKENCIMAHDAKFRHFAGDYTQPFKNEFILI